jgi:hypothetical protein
MSSYIFAYEKYLLSNGLLLCTPTVLSTVRFEEDTFFVIIEGFFGHYGTVVVRHLGLLLKILHPTPTQLTLNRSLDKTS